MLRIMWAIGAYDYMLKIQKSVLSATQYPQACGRLSVVGSKIHLLTWADSCHQRNC